MDEMMEAKEGPAPAAPGGGGGDPLEDLGKVQQLVGSVADGLASAPNAPKEVVAKFQEAKAAFDEGVAMLTGGPAKQAPAGQPVAAEAAGNPGARPVA